LPTVWFVALAIGYRLRCHSDLPGSHIECISSFCIQPSTAVYPSLNSPLRLSQDLLAVISAKVLDLDILRSAQTMGSFSHLPCASCWIANARSAGGCWVFYGRTVRHRTVFMV
jgi:hypothetical protein